MEITQKIESLLLPLLEDTDLFVVDIKINPTNNIVVFLDADEGVTVAKCTSTNKKLYAAIEDAQLFVDGDFSLEVSSAGVGEPLKQQRQYIKNVGRLLEVTPLEGDVFEGKLIAADDEKISVEVVISKKKETTIITVPYTAIKQSTVQISF
jgi:ribosome maturation factor RimP